tara:strand:- start:170 stop:613 length:444 start_codon:yes stop_codon:yes gene_type:complete
MFCIECGTKLDPSQKFCKNCGASIKTQPQTSTKVYNQNETINTKNRSLKKAFQLRQQDIGWGYALAHLIPFVGVFYAFSRKTITPFLIVIGVNLSTGFLVGFLMFQSSEEEMNVVATLLSFFTTPVAAKVGITKARTYAKKRLDEIE